MTLVHVPEDSEQLTWDFKLVGWLSECFSSMSQNMLIKKGSHPRKNCPNSRPPPPPSSFAKPRQPVCCQIDLLLLRWTSALSVSQNTFELQHYLSMALNPVELNPNFLEDLISAGKGKGIIIYDEIGGTLEPTATFGNGKTSRSLLAVYQVSCCTWSSSLVSIRDHTL